MIEKKTQAALAATQDKNRIANEIGELRDQSEVKERKVNVLQRKVNVCACFPHACSCTACSSRGEASFITGRCYWPFRRGRKGKSAIESREPARRFNRDLWSQTVTRGFTYRLRTWRSS